MICTPSFAARALAGLACAMWLWLSVAACGSLAYDRSVKNVYDALDHGDAGKALGVLDREVAAARPEREALLRLERAIVRLRVGQFAEAASDLAAADPVLEVLDLDRDVDGQLAAQLVSEAAGNYRPPPFEKLLVNALGMASRLAADDVESARIEARRFEVLAKYYDAQHTAEHEAAAVGRALAALVAEVSAHKALSVEGADGELVVLVASGRVPRRVSVRHTRAEIEARLGLPAPEADAKRSLNVLGLDGGAAPSLTEVAIDGVGVPLSPIGNPAASARATFERQSARLYRAALNREGLRHGAKRASNGGVLGFFVGATLEGNDTPDTRAWSLLPAGIHRVRVRVRAGAHTLRIGDRTIDATVIAGQIRVVFAALP